jgi:ATP-binding cassette subfamily B protein
MPQILLALFEKSVYKDIRLLIFMKEIWQYFWEEIKPYKWWYLLLLQTIITAPLYYVFYNYSIKLVLDVLTLKEAFEIAKLYTPFILYISTEIYINIMWRLSNFAGLNCIPQTENAITLKTYNYVVHHSYKFFTEMPSGQIISKIKGVTDGFNHLRNQFHYQFAGMVMTVFACIVAISFVAPILGGFMFAWLLLFAMISGLLARKMERISFEESSAKHLFNGKLADTITNIQTLFSFASRKREFEGFKRHFKEEVLPKQKAVWRFDMIFQAIGGVLYVFFLSGALFFTIYLKIKELLSVGDMYFILGLTWHFIDTAWRATVEFEILLRNIGDLKSSFNIIKIPNEPDKNEGKLIEITKPKIEFKGIGFRYAEDVVFDGLDLTIKAGEKVGLVGLSGAGKSTLVSLLMRYNELSSGQILISEQNIADFSKNSLREQIAVIPQDIMLFNRTIGENMSYAKPNASKEEVIEASKKAYIHTFIQNLPQGYETLVGERGVKLSGGQRQRVGIARAILKNAPVLILDEATSSLDTESEAYIQNSINNLLSEEITVIAIAHRLATLKNMDRILVLEKGKITQEGTHEELLAKNGLYKHLWEGQKI